VIVRFADIGGIVDCLNFRLINHICQLGNRKH